MIDPAPQDTARKSSRRLVLFFLLFLLVFGVSVSCAWYAGKHGTLPGVVSLKNSGAIAVEAFRDVFELRSEKPVLVVPLDETPVVPLENIVTEHQRGNDTKKSKPPLVAKERAVSPAAKPQTSAENVASKESRPVPTCPFAGKQNANHKVVFNEIAWMGTLPPKGVSASVARNNEWIELRNNSGETVALMGWQIIAATGTFRIAWEENGSMAPGALFLLKRTDDGTLPQITADKIYNGSLDNRGMWLRLFDDKCQLVDEVDGHEGWPAGKSASWQTMERDIATFDWHTSAVPGGTPKATNSNVIGRSEREANIWSKGNGPYSDASSGGGDEAAAGPIRTNVRLLITEIKIAAPGDSHNEFVEIYNPSDFAVSLEGWSLQKKTKSASVFSTFVPKTLLAGVIISPRDYLLIAYPGALTGTVVETDYGLAENNTLLLKNAEGETSDKVGWGDAGDCEGTCAPNPEPGTSISRNNAFADTGNNGVDFSTVSCPHPGGKSGNCVSSVPPLGGGSFTPPAASPPGTTVVPAVLIVEIQTTGGEGKSGNDIIRLYNKGGTADISGWKLRKRTQTGSESSIRVVPSGTAVSADTFFVWANSGEGFSDTVGAQISSSQTISDNNSVGLFNADGVLVDAVAWGSGHVTPFIEGTAFPENPKPGQVLRRKGEGANLIDSGNNSTDFELR